MLTKRLFLVHHMVQDAWSLQLFFEDINQSLILPDQELSPHDSFGAWADSFQALRHSPKATQSIFFHVQRLADLYLHKKSLYPPEILPRAAISEYNDAYHYEFDVSDLLFLKKEKPCISGATVLKAAMALVNVCRTGHSHALFHNLEAGRGYFPFMPDSWSKLTTGPLEATDVNGPTMQGVCNLIEVDPMNSSISSLEGLQNDQHELTTHAHAPLRRILAELGAQGNGADDVLMEAHRAQFLTWVGSLGEYSHLDVIQVSVRAPIGLVIVGGLKGPTATTFTTTLRWDAANFSCEQTVEFAYELEAAILWLTAPMNRTSALGEFLTSRASRD